MTHEHYKLIDKQNLKKMLIYLISDDYDSQIQYNNANVVSDFKIKLAQKFELFGNWEVALVEAHIPFTWVEHINLDLFVKLTLLHVEFNDQPHYKYLKVDLAAINNKTIDDIIKEINTKFDLLALNAIKFKRNKDQHIQIKLNQDKFNSGTTEATSKVECVGIEFSESLASILGYEKKNINVDGDDIFIAQFTPFLPPKLTAIVIHCDLIENQYISSKLQRVLRILPVQDKQYVETNGFIFHNPYFLPMRKTRFNSIHIRCLDVDDKRIQFESGVVIICLKLRPSTSLHSINN